MIGGEAAPVGIDGQLATKGDAVALPDGGVIDTGVQVITTENVADFEKSLAEMKNAG